MYSSQWMKDLQSICNWQSRSLETWHCIAGIVFQYISKDQTAFNFKDWGAPALLKVSNEHRAFKASGNTNPVTQHHIPKNLDPQAQLQIKHLSLIRCIIRFCRLYHSNYQKICLWNLRAQASCVKPLMCQTIASQQCVSYNWNVMCNFRLPPLHEWNFRSSGSLHSIEQ